MLGNLAGVVGEGESSLVARESRLGTTKCRRYVWGRAARSRSHCAIFFPSLTCAPFSYMCTLLLHVHPSLAVHSNRLKVLTSCDCQNSMFALVLSNCYPGMTANVAPFLPPGRSPVENKRPKRSGAVWATASRQSNITTTRVNRRNNSMLSMCLWP